MANKFIPILIAVFGVALGAAAGYFIVQIISENDRLSIPIETSVKQAGKTAAPLPGNFQEPIAVVKIVNASIEKRTGKEFETMLSSGGYLVSDNSMHEIQEEVTTIRHKPSQKETAESLYHTWLEDYLVTEFKDDIAEDEEFDIQIIIGNQLE